MIYARSPVLLRNQTGRKIRNLVKIPSMNITASKMKRTDREKYVSNLFGFNQVSYTFIFSTFVLIPTRYYTIFIELNVCCFFFLLTGFLTLKLGSYDLGLSIAGHVRPHWLFHSQSYRIIT